MIGNMNQGSVSTLLKRNHCQFGAQNKKGGGGERESVTPRQTATAWWPKPWDRVNAREEREVSSVCESQVAHLTHMTLSTRVTDPKCKCIRHVSGSPSLQQRSIDGYI